ncbi:MAG: hypothetical protein E7157_03800 [Lactobacillales bacterium]|nr:hypothetical protein [Lactobacillales bacterium]
MSSKKEIQKEENMMKKQINQIGLFVQIILLVILVYFLTLLIFMPEFRNVVDYILSFLLIIMAVNNYKIYKRKKMTIIYGVIGIILLVLTILGV